MRPTDKVFRRSRLVRVYSLVHDTEGNFNLMRANPRAIRLLRRITFSRFLRESLLAIE